ncbi:SCPU domain-containing protein [Rickettsiales endosymbiont of Peranema trichophorum]|uniref:Csu type fimbrial protein n=1 Tax=Rickettsiales endosymbiont of Peranema trichophorum TaxID=2486577 RepID=UPI0010235BE7|nr:spore coat U domain-containing protein [Rickettsiales endosymbiont of Peranema trichophorum]RZI47671.1 SCPU domain-containing protein [Rickettsiales endosymbiont of Peranema trichophorum]
MIFTGSISKLSQLCRILSLGSAAVLMTYNVAYAGNKTLTQKLVVTTNVEAACTLATNGTLSFASYTGQEVQTEGTITATCNAGTEYTIDLDNGQNSDGTQRRMVKEGANPKGYILYELYSDASKQSRFGSDADGYVKTKDASLGGETSIPVYGVIAAGQKPPVGSYADTITVTLSF